MTQFLLFTHVSRPVNPVYLITDMSLSGISLSTPVLVEIK